MKKALEGLVMTQKKIRTKTLILSKADNVPNKWILQSKDKILGHLNVNRGGGDIVRFFSIWGNVFSLAVNSLKDRKKPDYIRFSVILKLLQKSTDLDKNW